MCVFVCALTFPQCARSLSRKVLFAGGDNEQIVHGELNGCWSGEVSGAMTCRGDVRAAVNQSFSVHTHSAFKEILQ